LNKAADTFRPERLRQAREARSITQTALARMVSVSPQSVSLYERGATKPGPETLEKVSSSLGVPFRFFFEELTHAEGAAANYRSLSAATKSARLSCERQYEWLVEIVHYVQRFIRLPAFDVPTVRTPAPTAISSQTIEDAAAACRRAWGLGEGPISNVVWLLENHGCIVSRFPFDADTLDALSLWNESIGRGFVLLNADKQSAARSRFDASHELAHLVLHREVGPKAERPELWRLLENQAHRFSGAFLLPATAFVEDFVAGHSVEHSIRLKERWGCSLAMMFHRAKDLHILDDADYKRLAIMLGRRGWRQREPLDEALAPERPQLLPRSFQLIVERGVRSIATIRQELPLSMNDVTALTGLAAGFLSEQPPTGEIIELPAVPPDPPNRPVAKTIDVVPFPSRSEDRKSDGANRDGG
jgi:Zn-dependent peptidase ImmA (M78 family)/transcriptional regulator with XRE-family HTH domain